MELNLTGKVAVISGGGTGIGKALALEYLKEGVQVCTFGRRLTVLEKFAQECRAAGHEIYYEQLDITDTKGLESYAARVFKQCRSGLCKGIFEVYAGGLGQSDENQSGGRISWHADCR